MRTTLLAVTALTLSACAGNSFDGKVAGETLAIKSAVFLQNHDSSGKPTSASIYFADVDGSCDYVKANRQPKNGTYVGFFLFNRDSNGNEIAAGVGDYTVIDLISLNGLTQKGDFASSNFVKDDASCNNVLSGSSSTAKSGLLKVSSFKAETGGGISGSFDITYGDQADKVSGSFNADYCDANFTTSPNCE